MDKSTGPKIRVLLIDDDPVIQRALSLMLEMEGLEVTEALCGQQALDIFCAAQRAGTPFALVMTDLDMPRLDGRQVALAVKAAAPRTRVWLLTGWAHELTPNPQICSAVDLLLSKPPKRNELRSALAQAALGGIQ